MLIYPPRILREGQRAVRYPAESAILESAWELIDFAGKHSGLGCDMCKQVERALRMPAP